MVKLGIEKPLCLVRTFCFFYTAVFQYRYSLRVPARGVFIVTRKPPVIQVVLKSLSYKKSNKKKKTSDI
ncbi:hypothetical protein, partial [[Clostridium] innocuum]|uniref:hypothetical protein n=1 Tax=Clostridium innocuum TaxID=1522 RepID=UPI001C22316E